MDEDVQGAYRTIRIKKLCSLQCSDALGGSRKGLHRAAGIDSELSFSSLPTLLDQLFGSRETRPDPKSDEIKCARVLQHARRVRSSNERECPDDVTHSHKMHCHLAQSDHISLHYLNRP